MPAHVYFRRPPLKIRTIRKNKQVYITWKISIIIKLVRMKQRNLSYVQIYCNWYVGSFKCLFRGEFPNMPAKIFSSSAILKIGTIKSSIFLVVFIFDRQSKVKVFGKPILIGWYLYGCALLVRFPHKLRLCAFDFENELTRLPHGKS